MTGKCTTLDDQLELRCPRCDANDWRQDLFSWVIKCRVCESRFRPQFNVQTGQFKIVEQKNENK